MPGILSEIVANKLAEVAARKAGTPEDVLKRNAAPGDRRFLGALAGHGLRIIAEIKPRSPSAGILRSAIDIDKVLIAYDRYASAISVLTDEKYFDGSLDLLSAVKRKSLLPVLCKDFILDSYQVYEARLAGADAVLLIVKLLDDRQLADLHGTIDRLAMVPVVEVQNEAELERAFKLPLQAVLINNRDLTTFEIDLDTTRRLAPLVPPGILTVAASGIQTRAHIESLRSCCCCFLIGSSLMQAQDLEAKLKELTGL